MESCEFWTVSSRILYCSSWRTSPSCTQDYWVFWTFTLSGILENRKHDISETGSVSVLR
jgi:hypothetical protein